MATSSNGKGSDTGTGTGSRNGEPEASDSLRTFGAVLKALREEAGLTQERLSEKVGFSVPYVAKIEQGRRYPPRDLADRAEECLGHSAANVLRAAERSLTRRTGLPAYFQEWAAIEEDALALYAYECRAIPGLLQPEAYMRAIFDLLTPPIPEEQAEIHIADRLARQRLLTEGQDTVFSFILEQALLERCMGGRDVTLELLDHLVTVGRRKNVEIQVMPLRQERHSGIDGLMYLAETPDARWIGYTEGHQASHLITDPHHTSKMLLRYGTLRSQALNLCDSARLLKELRGRL
ncbi:helix-turn-helix domain-containing protein [Streptomyces sp. NPDC059740]|uniref:helix-turn-helix domain-containing protein n=1 Tax=Streptomyces sp. NPDC059740 TaxID=3346926 RepID=UPI0036551743